MVLASECGMEAGEKRRLGCPRSSPSGCTCNVKNRVINDRWREHYTRRTLAGRFGSRRCARGAGSGVFGCGGDDDGRE